MNGHDFMTGGLYSVEDSGGSYRIAKILVLDEEAVHVRLYKNKFADRPSTIAPATLSLGGIYDPDGFGIEHLPLASEVFLSWNPVFLVQETVSKEELLGYETWAEADGGVFGSS